MTTAADIVAEASANEAAAVVAGAAAESAVVAADAAVALAHQQAAQVTANAAETIRENEGELQWLTEKTNSLAATMEATNMATMEKLSSLETMVLSLNQRLASAESPSPTPGAQSPSSADAGAPENLPPVVAVGVEVEPPAPPVQPEAPAKKRLRRL